MSRPLETSWATARTRESSAEPGRVAASRWWARTARIRRSTTMST